MMFKSYILTALITLWLVSLSVGVDKDNSCPDLSTPLLDDYDDQDSLPLSSGPLVEIELTEIKSNEDDANLHLAQDLVQSIENLQQGLSDSNLAVQTVESCQENLEAIKNEVEQVLKYDMNYNKAGEVGFTNADLKAASDFFNGIIKTIPDFMSGDPNKQWNASFTVAASMAKLGDAYAPPLGTIFHLMFAFAGQVAPWPTNDETSVADVLDEVLRKRFDQYADEKVKDEMRRSLASLRSLKQLVYYYADYPKETLVERKDKIYLVLNSDANNDSSYAFMNVLKRYILGPNKFNDGLFEQTNPHRVANYIYNFHLIAQDNINLARQRAAIFSRMGNKEMDIFWRHKKVRATQDVAYATLKGLVEPPSRETSGISKVIQALHVILSHEERESLEEFMQKELGLKMPGKVLQVRNIKYDHFMSVTQGNCPIQDTNVMGTDPTSGFNQGYHKDYVACNWVETTPGSSARPGRTDYSKIFRVYGNGGNFTMWNVGVGAYLRQRESFLPTYSKYGARANAQHKWSHFPTLSLPLKFQVESPVTNSSMWEYDFFKSSKSVAPASCNEFALGNKTDDDAGDTIFSRCQWNHGLVHWAIYSTDYGTKGRFGNGRKKNQVLMRTSKNGKCCAREGWSDTVAEKGTWEFHDLNGEVFHLDLA